MTELEKAFRELDEIETRQKEDAQRWRRATMIEEGLADLDRRIAEAREKMTEAERAEHDAKMKAFSEKVEQNRKEYDAKQKAKAEREGWVERLLPATLIPIPQEDGPAWDRFCEDYGIYPVNGERRGWMSQISEYLRGSTHLVMMDGIVVSTWCDDEEPEED